MPIYEYKCVTCGEVTERSRSINFRDRPIECPKCGHPAKVLVSRVAGPETKSTRLRRKLDRKERSQK